MRNLLALAALAVIGFLAIGYFRHWYSIESTPTSNGGRHFEIDVNSKKITQDIRIGEDKLRELLAKEKKEGASPNGVQLPNGVSAVFRGPTGEVSLPPIPSDSVDISDHDGWWPSLPRK